MEFNNVYFLTKESYILYDNGSYKNITNFYMKVSDIEKALGITDEYFYNLLFTINKDIEIKTFILKDENNKRDISSYPSLLELVSFDTILRVLVMANTKYRDKFLDTLLEFVYDFYSIAVSGDSLDNAKEIFNFLTESIKLPIRISTGTDEISLRDEYIIKLYEDTRFKEV